MPLTDCRLNIAPRIENNLAAHNFNQLQTDLVSRARIWAVDEVGAAMAHQLNEPLTALLLYLHKIKDQGEHSTGAEAISDSMRDMVEMALRETERVCDIIDRFGHTFEAPTDSETALARAREAIESWTQSSNANGNASPSPTPPPTNQRHLTPREREVLAMITRGTSNKEGSRRMGISTRTFEVHRAHIMEKLGARNAADLVRMALSEVH